MLKVTAVWVMVAMYTDIATEGTPAVCPADWKRLALIASLYLSDDLYHSLSATKPLNHWLALSVSLARHTKSVTISSLRAKFISAAKFTPLAFRRSLLCTNRWMDVYIMDVH